jgi:HD-like signal output (HDOD) protein
MAIVDASLKTGEFISEILNKINLPTTTRLILEKLIQIDAKAETFAKIIVKNQALENALVTQLRALGVKNEISQLENYLVLMGIHNVRNFICAYQNIRQFKKTKPKLGSDGKYDLQIHENLRFALKAEDYAIQKKIPYPDTIFAAGYLFDRIYLFFKNSKSELLPSFYRHLDENFQHGLKTARICYEIYKNNPQIGYGKYIFSAGLIHDIGRSVMEWLYRNETYNYHRYLLLIAKKSYDEETALAIESSLFGVNHGLFSGLYLWGTEIFRPIEKALLFHHEPFLLEEIAPDQVALAQLVLISSTMAKKINRIEKLDDKILKSWIPTQAGLVKINGNHLLQAMNSISGDLF